MQTPLTEQEENFLKDVLRFVAIETALSKKMATIFELSYKDFEALSDSCWQKLQNGRITIISE